MMMMRGLWFLYQAQGSVPWRMPSSWRLLFGSGVPPMIFWTPQRHGRWRRVSETAVKAGLCVCVTYHTHCGIQNPTASSFHSGSSRHPLVIPAEHHHTYPVIQFTGSADEMIILHSWHTTSLDAQFATRICKHLPNYFIFKTFLSVKCLSLIKQDDVSEVFACFFFFFYCPE